MQFIITDTFTDSLARLDPQSKGLVAAAVFEFKANPEHPSFQLHRLDAVKDKRFWSARVSQDLRFIVLKDGDNTVVCYADHHDAAYAWAERRRLDVNELTGVPQFVTIGERHEEIVHQFHTAEVHGPALFASFDDDYLLALGVPAVWLDAVKIADDAQFVDQLIEELPREASEALMRLASGELVPRPKPVPVKGSDPFRHPAAQRSFRVIDDDRVLEQALAAPWNKWVVFLHPTQQEVVDRDFNGPARVTGGAGTGKTVVALHRAVRLARANPDARILLTTYSKTLAARLHQHLLELVGEDAPELGRIRVDHFHHVATELWRGGHDEAFHLANGEKIEEALGKAAKRVGGTDLSLAFLKSEWDAVVNAEGIRTWEAYRSFARVGRGTPLGARQRMQAWSVFEALHHELEQAGERTYERLCYETAAYLDESGERPFDHVVADEIQDFGPAELGLLRALVGDSGSLFLAGDLGQRIYKGGTSFLRAGIDVRGRSSRLRVNYRTTEQIRRYADRILPAALTDPDGEEETRDAISLFSGPEPKVVQARNPAEEIEKVTEFLKRLTSNGYAASDIAIFTRTNALVEERAKHVAGRLGLKAQLLKDDRPLEAKRIAIGTMHRAKGLEFKVVVVMGCEERYLPNQYVLGTKVDDVERALFVEQERNLFYVACTRAREHLLVTCGGPPSPFLGM